MRSTQDSVALERTAGNALQLMAEAVYSPAFLDFRPSLVAAGVLTSARKAAGVWPFWPSSLAQLTGAPRLCPKRWRLFLHMRGAPVSLRQTAGAHRVHGVGTAQRLLQAVSGVTVAQ